MRPQKYRLQAVLDIRATAKDEAARLVAAKYELLARAEEELMRRQRNLQNCYERQNQAQAKLSSDLAKACQAKTVQSYKNYLRDLRNLETELLAAVEEQKQAVLKAETAVEEARAKLVEAARELKAIETHKTNWQNARTAEFRRREQKLSDEVGSMLHNMRDKS